MKKRVNTDAIKNELEGSVFFPVKNDTPAPTQAKERRENTQQEEQFSQSPLPVTKELPNENPTPRYQDTNIDTMIPSNHDTMIPINEEDMIEEVRKAVKQIGKEPATQRLTLEEKKALRAIEFTYGQQGIMTSGNEIMRIATNYIVRDYQKNGENSILAKVLKRLNS